MTSYRYNQQVRPPAPFVYVTLQKTDGEQAISDQPAQLDTAADRTVLPLHLTEQLGLAPLDSMPAMGFGGIVINVPTFLVRLSLRGEASITLEVFGSKDEPHILLGRDILNYYRIIPDGPKLMLEVG